MLGRSITSIVLVCVSGGVQTAKAQAEPVSPANTCDVDPAIWRLEFEASAVEATAGERVSLRWSKFNGKFGEYLAPECLTDWRISDPALATLSSDRRTITISAAAEAGIVTVSVRFKSQEASASVRIRRKDEPILAGLWRRASADNCSKPPTELWFGRNGRFSYTFPEHMIETMQSGSGTYTWDWQTGSVTLGQMRGKAERFGATLITDRLEFGWPNSPTSHCKITWQEAAEK